LLGAAAAPVVGGYALVVTVLTLVTMVAPRAEFSGWDVLLASGPGWLAVYQVPLELSGAELGVLPLLPTVGAAVLVARAAAGAVHRLGELRPSPTVPVVVTVTGAHAVVASIVVVGSAGTGVQVDPLRGVGTPMLLSGVFAVLGALRARTAPAWTARSRGRRFDPVALRGIRAGLLGLAALCTSGALVALVAT
ncbi:cell division protein PerM, partial [Saccharomonospora iraqiensis]|uniref:cell division protein PerM n=1 Tax=Saccharomonospora iraqiensis TaxID=52698 RepID=UPI00022E00CF